MMTCCSSDRALAVTNGHPTCYINTFKTISAMVLDAAMSLFKGTYLHARCVELL